MPRDGKCIKSLIQQTGDILGRMGVPDSEDKRVEFWSILLDNLPEWYKGQQLTVIDSHFTSIVHKILEHAKDRTIQKAVTKYKLG